MEKVGRHNHLVKHLGTARNQWEHAELLKSGQEFIDQKRIRSGKISLFDNQFERGELAKVLSRLSFKRPIDRLTYDCLWRFYQCLGFGEIDDDCFRDLVIARIAYPTSKRQTQAVLETNFDRRYPLNKIYDTLKRVTKLGYQQKAEKIVKDFVLQNISPEISLLFFDVTTLYFEAFNEDGFRKLGFSKDNKANQPQITVALTVTRYGIPLSFQSFAGNKFEGHLMLPVISNLVESFRLKAVIVVADSAMMSEENLKLLEDKGIKYIVGARLGNLTEDLLKKVVESTTKQDGESFRLSLPASRVLVVSYSQRRAAKDKSDREKKVKRATKILSRPQTVVKGYKFLLSRLGGYELNRKLIEKAKLLEGLKGYLTNALDLTNDEIIQRYGELWQVERAFRMSKSDLKARPIFHSLRESIEAHLLIVFVALVVSRWIELATRKSIARVVKILNQVKEIAVEDNLSKETVLKSTELTKEAEEILKSEISLGSPKK